MPSPNTPEYEAEWNKLLRNNNSLPINADGRADLNRRDSFVHDPNQSVADGRDYKFEFIPNILDNYDQFTYHWKFFMTSLENAHSGAILETKNQVIIAESGVTDMTIDKVRIESVAGPNARNGTGTSTTFTFELIEPSGAGLIDKMFYQAVGLGLGNWKVTPFFLQLNFKGRSPSTSETNETGTPPGMEGTTWLWDVQVTTVEAHVSHVGTRYKFNGIMYNEKAQTDLYYVLQQKVSLDGLSTFGAAMQQLEDKLNVDQYDKLIENYEIPDSYTIVVDPALAVIDISDPGDNISTKFSSEYSKDVNYGKKTAQYNAGTGIDKIVDSLLINTSRVQVTMQQSDTPDSTPKPITAVSDQMKKLWRIVTETRPVAYDTLRQQPAVDITIFIVQYDIGALDVTAAQTGQTSKDITASKLRMGEYVRKKIMKKKYNYIFTGLNDQIIKFDLDMNFAFQSVKPRFGGAYYDSFISTPGIAVRRDALSQEQRVKKLVKDTIAFIHNSPNDSSVLRKIEYAQAAISEATSLDPSIVQKYIDLLNNARAEDRRAYVAKTKKDKIDDARRYARLIGAPVNLTNSHGNVIGTTTFLSDINTNDELTKAAHEAALSLSASKLHPVAFSEGIQEAAVTFGIDPSKMAARSRVSSIFATALYTTQVDNAMAAVKLTIKGDPYWLFPRGVDSTSKVLKYRSLMDKLEAINDIKDNTSKKSVNIHSSDNFIVIRFRTPRLFDNDGIIADSDTVYNEVETFSGVYKIATISNTFEMGKFTQELSCLLDPAINLVDFLGELDKADATPNIAIVEGVPISVPSTSLKTPSRIAITRIGADGVAYVNTQEYIINTLNSGLGASSNIPPHLESDEA